MTSYFDEDMEMIARNFGLKLRYLLIRIYNFFFYDNTRRSDYSSTSSDELEDITFINNSNDIYDSENSECSECSDNSDSSDDDIEEIKMDYVKNLLDELD